MSTLLLVRTARSAVLAMSLLITGCDKIDDLPIGTAYTAKHMCSGLFVSGLDKHLVLNRFIAPKVEPLPLLWNVKIDETQKTVTVSDKIFGSLFAASAVYRDNIGCTLLAQQTVGGTLDILSQRVTPVSVPPLNEGEWPYGNGGVTSMPDPALDLAAINAAVDSAFIEDSEGPRNTTSLLVVYKGKLVAEKYALGVTPATPVLGWSMTKTITGMLIGILHESGQVDIDQPAPVVAWQGTDKAGITTRDLLHMSSGLKFNEDYLGLSDVSAMLYRKADMARYALGRRVVAAPGTVFNYATGDSLILSHIVQQTVGAIRNRPTISIKPNCFTSWIFIRHLSNSTPAVPLWEARMAI